MVSGEVRVEVTNPQIFAFGPVAQFQELEGKGLVNQSQRVKLNQLIESKLILPESTRPWGM